MSKQNSSKFISISFEIPIQDDLQKFINKARNTAEKEARKQWHQLSAVPKKKGGRPSKEDLIFNTCDTIWKEWKEGVPRRLQTKARLIGEVQERTKTFNSKSQEWKQINDKTIIKHVTTWLGVAIPFDELPMRILIDFFRDGDGILGWLRMGLLGSEILALKPQRQNVQHGTTFNEFLIDLEKKPKELKNVQQDVLNDSEVQSFKQLIETFKLIQADPVGRELLKKQIPSFVKQLYAQTP